MRWVFCAVAAIRRAGVGHSLVGMSSALLRSCLVWARGNLFLPFSCTSKKLKFYRASYRSPPCQVVQFGCRRTSIVLQSLSTCSSFPVEHKAIALGQNICPLTKLPVHLPRALSRSFAPNGSPCMLSGELYSSSFISGQSFERLFEASGLYAQ